jgi:CRP/FNR family transcriptional regulator
MKDSPELQEKIFNLFPLFRNASQDVQAELFEHGKLAELPAGQFICHEGSKCSCIPLVLEGRARVYKLSESGREITLYRVEPGESCIMTASCILSGVEFPAFAATETKVEAIVISPEFLHRWVNQYEVWRQFLCGMLASRLSEVIAVVEEVAFRRVDTRTAEYLLHSGGVDGAIRKTHQDIATDIGTSREVVSRILKEFEHQGLITLARGEIQTENSNALQLVANQGHSSRGVQPL